MTVVYMKDGRLVTPNWVSMFGLTNSKELMLRVRQAGVPVGHAFFEAHQRDQINVCADELEDCYAGFNLKIRGENVVTKDNGWFWLDETLGCKLQSTIQPQSFVTLPPHYAALANDLIASGLYRYWGETE